ncbi:MAG: hypothetical protein ACREQR_02305 [Candidatus Binataceae bacterium]
MQAASVIKHRFKSKADVEKFWREVRNVPARARRTKRDEERYALGLLLLARAGNDLINFPIVITEGESPDFLITEAGSKCVGLEVTRASARGLQKRMTNAERSGDASAVAIDMDDGLLADESEARWCEQLEKAINDKLAKFGKYRPASRYDLLVYGDASSLLWNRESARPTLTRWLCDVRRSAPLLGKVSIIVSLDVAYDLDGDCRYLEFINWLAPDKEAGFGERVEHAAQKAVRDELSKTAPR